MFLSVSEVTSEEVYSYLVIRGAYKYIRVRYQAVGTGYVDQGLLDSINSAPFDKLDPATWLSFRGNLEYNTRHTNPLLNNDLACSALTQGIEAIKEAVKPLAPQADTVGIKQVTDLELRQSTLDVQQATVLGDFLAMRNEFNALLELQASIKNTIENGYFAQVPLSSGKAYSSDTAELVHTFVHGLNSYDLDVQVWAQDSDGLFSIPLSDVAMTHPDVVVITSDEPLRVRITVRLMGTGSFIYESLVPKTDHPMVHNLNTMYPSMCLWVNDQGVWRRAVASTRMVDGKNIVVTTDVAVNIRAIIQAPLQNAYIGRTTAPSTSTIYNHRLNTGFVTATLWVEGSNGQFAMEMVRLSMRGLNTISFETPTGVNSRIVVQPILEEIGNEHIVAHNEHLLLMDRMTEVDASMVTVTSRLISTELAIKTITDGVYRYTSDVAKSIHLINHQLNEDIPEVEIYVLDIDNVWRRDAMRVEIVDANNIRAILANPSFLKAKIRR